jgi:hypothetical protein
VAGCTCCLSVQGAALLLRGDCTGIDHAHGCDSDFYRSEHRHSNCPRSRCLSVGLVRSTCCATSAQTTLGKVRDRGLDCRIFGRLPSISSVQPPVGAHAFTPPTQTSLFGTIDALALADVHAQRAPAAVDPDVVRNRPNPKIPVWIMGAPSGFDCHQLPARPRLRSM